MLHDLWLFSISGGVPRRSLAVAAVVGSMLTLINQYDALFGAVAFSWLKAALTYCVPYLVSTYGAVTAKLHAKSHAKLHARRTAERAQAKVQ
jgi:hypothetical protein